MQLIDTYRPMHLEHGYTSGSMVLRAIADQLRPFVEASGWQPVRAAVCATAIH
jgi:hypothetical protein